MRSESVGPSFALSKVMKTNKSILIIEDNHDMRVCLRQHLENEGYQVLSATNGKDALEIIQSGFVPKIIVMDLQMPLMSGEEFLTLKNNISSLYATRTVVISGKYQSDPGLNVEQYLPKPLDWAVFSHTVSELQVV